MVGEFQQASQMNFDTDMRMTYSIGFVPKFCQGLFVFIYEPVQNFLSSHDSFFPVFPDNQDVDIDRNGFEGTMTGCQ